MLEKVAQRSLQCAFWDICANFGGKKAEMSKMSLIFVKLSVVFQLKVEHFGEIKASKTPSILPRSSACFSK